MKRFASAIWIIVKIILVSILAVWIMRQHGEVAMTLDHDGTPMVYSMDLPVILAVLVILGLLLLALARLYHSLTQLPEQIALKQERKRLAEGYQALTQSLVAIAAGDGAGAEKLAQQAAKKLNQPPLSLLVHAQAAQLQGDTAAAGRFFHQLASDPKAGFLGLRGQLMQEMKLALTSGQVDAARRLAVDAESREPRSPWVMQVRFALEARAKNWPEVEQLLARGIQSRAFNKEDGKWYQAALLLTQSQESASRPEAFQLARRAWDACPTFTPAAVRYAELLLAAGRRNTAVDIIAKTWVRLPQPDLIPAWMKLAPAFSDTPNRSMANLKWLDRLLSRNESDPESLLPRAKALLDAKLWGEARSLLLHLRQTQDTRCYDLLARLEMEEKNDTAAANAWRGMSTGKTKAAWVCKHDNARTDTWQLLCPTCGSFASLHWRNAAQNLPALLAA